jgi:hypothetical protein
MKAISLLALNSQFLLLCVAFLLRLLEVQVRLIIGMFGTGFALAVQLLRGMNGRAAAAERKTTPLKTPLLKIARPFMAGKISQSQIKVPQGRKGFNPTSPAGNHIHVS